ncbi:MAG: Arc family DNA-binding protein [Rubrivivax sp.]|nr:Arc family DNA-binding protein [Rubrivivax sp.]
MNLSIKDVPDAVAERLRVRALRNHRSLQGELMAIIQSAVAAEPEPTARTAEQHDTSASMAARAIDPPAPGPRVWVQGWKSVAQLMEERRISQWQPHPSMAAAPTGTDMIRADRDSR